MQTSLAQLANRASTKLHAHLPSRARKALWNLEYRLGRWSYLDHGDSTALIDLITRYRADGSMLDLGCGTAANFAPPPEFTYHGVDISDEAIQEAQQLGRPRATFEVADICQYQPSATYDVILMREVVYYLPVSAIPSIVDRMRTALAPGGIFVIQVWNSGIYGPVIDAVTRSHLAVVEQVDHGHGGCILVLAHRRES